MRHAIFLIALLVTAACGAYHFPGDTAPPPPEATGTVGGRVVAVPCTPVEQVGQTCAGRPVAGLELDYSDPHQQLFKAVTDSTGGYSLTLPAATYKVTLKTYMRVLTGPLVITVTAGSTTNANYTLDSGIRQPTAG